MFAEGGVELRQVFTTYRRRAQGLRERSLTLLCECGDPGCRRVVELSAEEYDASRPGLIVHPEHARGTVVSLADRRAARRPNRPTSGL